MRPMDQREIHSLQVTGQVVADYHWRPDLPVALAPRPYLHPVRTLSGLVVTEFMPPSHPHHLGVSVAVPEVNRANFLGGRTFVPGHGPTWLDNQGQQQHQRWIRRTRTQLAHTITWLNIAQRQLMAEQRTISCQPLDDTAWALSVEFALTNVTDRDLFIRSPAVHGRPGAGYGGFIWRAPGSDGTPHQITTPNGTGLQAVHGHPSPWFCCTGYAASKQAWSLIFMGNDPDSRGARWFVRAGDYLCVGSSLAWDHPLVIVPGQCVTRRIVTVVADGIVDQLRAARYASELTG